MMPHKIGGFLLLVICHHLFANQEQYSKHVEIPLKTGKTYTGQVAKNHPPLPSGINSFYQDLLSNGEGNKESVNNLFEYFEYRIRSPEHVQASLNKRMNTIKSINQEVQSRHKDESGSENEYYETKFKQDVASTINFINDKCSDESGSFENKMPKVGFRWGCRVFHNYEKVRVTYEYNGQLKESPDIALAKSTGHRSKQEDTHLATVFSLDINDTVHRFELSAVFDGHGGDTVSKHCSENLTTHLQKRLTEFNPDKLTDEGIWNALKVSPVDLSITTDSSTAGSCAQHSLNY